MEFQTLRWSIEEAVLEILRNANLEEMTEYKVRTLAADRLGIDLSPPDRKRFVRSVVESFLASHKEDPSDAAETPLEDQQQVEGLAADKEEEEEEAKKEEEDRRRRRAPKEYDDEGNLIVCRLSKKRRVTVHEFRGKTLVSIREFYEKEGKQLPTAKGISLTVEQWEAFAKAVPAIEDAVNKMADENLRMIRASLPEAVEACMDAAGHEFDVSRQRTLLRAASYGRAFCSQFPRDRFQEMCKTLRVLNAVRNHEIGIPLSIQQYKLLTAPVLNGRLINSYNHLLALRVSEYLNLNPEVIIMHSTCTNISTSIAIDDASLLNILLDKLKLCKGISYATIAAHADNSGRRKLAAMLVDHELMSSKQVPLLLNIGEEDTALVKSTESGDTDLVSLVLFHIW